MSRDEAIAELRHCSGTQFDPKVVEKFIAIVVETDTGKQVEKATC
jgi:HD-GYP domain-containing protein (c-di-GMP phosphodiesterase class II)